MSQTRFIWYSITLSLALVMFSVSFGLFQNNKSVLIELISIIGFLSLIASIIINRGSIDDVVSKPIEIKPVLLLIGVVVAIGAIEYHFKIRDTSIGRIGVIALFIFCWVILIKKAWNKYRAVDA